MIAPNPIIDRPFASQQTKVAGPSVASGELEEKSAKNKIDFTALHEDIDNHQETKAEHETEISSSTNDHPLVKSLNKWLKQIYEKNKVGVDWIDKTLLDDKSIFRKIFSLENELAEALEPSMNQMKMPKEITSFVYRMLWGVCYLNTFTRVAIESLKQGNAIHGLKKLVQDGISVIACTTYFARGLNWLQDKIEDSVGVPSTLKNILRPFLTVGGCIKAIDYFDEYAGVPGGNLAVKGVEKLLNMTNKSAAPKAQVA